jgi:hypothetical protein
VLWTMEGLLQQVCGVGRGWRELGLQHHRLVSFSWPLLGYFLSDHISHFLDCYLLFKHRNCNLYQSMLTAVIVHALGSADLVPHIFSIQIPLFWLML